MLPTLSANVLFYLPCRLVWMKRSCLDSNRYQFQSQTWLSLSQTAKAELAVEWEADEEEAMSLETNSRSHFL
jgi:hypothetical protein